MHGSSDERRDRIGAVNNRSVLVALVNQDQTLQRSSFLEKLEEDAVHLQHPVRTVVLHLELGILDLADDLHKL